MLQSYPKKGHYFVKNNETTEEIPSIFESQGILNFFAGEKP